MGADKTQRPIRTPGNSAHTAVDEGHLTGLAVLDVGQPQPGHSFVVLQVALGLQPGHLGTVRGYGG